MEGRQEVLISVIIPIYNSEGYLKRCIDSILNQTYSSIEIILMNDVQDLNERNRQCRNICYEYKKSYKDKIQYHEGNFQGPSEARNLGMMYANGEYFYFMDSDDYCDKNMLKSFYETMIAEDADIGICGYIEYKNGKKKKYLYGKNTTISNKQFLESLLDGEKLGNYVWNKLFKKQVWKDIYFPRGEIFEDISTIYKVVMNSQKIVVLNKTLYYYIRRSDSISSTISYKNYQQQFLAIRKRNQAIINEYPELYDKAMINQLKYDIVILNQLFKKYSKEALRNEKVNILISDIKRLKGYLNRLSFKYRIMGILWDKRPELYIHILKIFFMKKR